MAVGAMVLAAQLDAALDRLDPGIAEEDEVGEADRDEPLRQPLLLGDAIEVGGVPQLRRLVLQRRDQMRMGVTERVHRNRSEEHTSELQSLMRISYAVFCLKKKKKIYRTKQ